MNALTITRRTSFLVLSPTLKAAVRASQPASFAAPGDESGFRVTAPYVPNQPAISEAQAAIGAAQASLKPIERAQFRKWLLSLMATVANPPASKEDFETKATALGMMVADLPAACFTDDTLTAAMRVFKFFPSGADLFAFAEEIAKPMRAEVEAIRRIAEFSYGAKAPEAPRQSATDAEKAEVAAKVAALKAESASEHVRTRIDVSAKHLRDEQLLEEYERTATDDRQPEVFRRLAETRVRLLRERLHPQEMADAAQ